MVRIGRGRTTVATARRQGCRGTRRTAEGAAPHSASPSARRRPDCPQGPRGSPCFRVVICKNTGSGSLPRGRAFPRPAAGTPPRSSSALEFGLLYGGPASGFGGDGGMKLASGAAAGSRKRASRSRTGSAPLSYGMRGRRHSTPLRPAEQRAYWVRSTRPGASRVAAANAPATFIMKGFERRRSPSTPGSRYHECSATS